MWNRSTVYSWVKGNGIAYAGKLYTGTDEYGIEHLARPISLSFDCSYIPVTNDNTDVIIKLYDSGKREIASARLNIANAIQSLTKQQIKLNYTDLISKAAYIYVSFQSGYDMDIAKMSQVNGSYSSPPYTCDRVVGSVLKIDNVTLNYDYE